jgi:hypothetical protein
MSPAVIIAYYAPDKEVMWWGEEEEPPHGKFNLHDRMRDWVVNGNTFEILEYIPGGWDEGVRGYLRDRAIWWDEQLRNLGYDVPMNRWSALTPAPKETDDA